MKKVYITPETEVALVALSSMLAGSVEEWKDGDNSGVHVTPGGSEGEGSFAGVRGQRGAFDEEW